MKTLQQQIADVDRAVLIDDLDQSAAITDTDETLRLHLNPAARTAYMDVDRSYRNCWTTAEHHGRVPVVDISTSDGTQVDADSLLAYLRGPDGQQLLAAVCDGYTEEWDGNNNVGRLTEDAQSALDSLGSYLVAAPGLDMDNAGYWDAREWLSPIDAELRARIESGEDISAIAEEITNEAADGYVFFRDSVSEYLDELAEEEEEEEEMDS